MEEEKMQDEDEINLLDYLIIILKRKKFIIKMTCSITLIIGIIVFLMPNKYDAVVRFLPPQQGSTASMASALLSQLGGLSSLLGVGSSSSGDMYVGMLTGNTILDKVIDRFDLMKRYKTGIYWILPFYREDCRGKIIDDVVMAANDPVSGIVTVTVEEEDPKLATNMVTSFVDELKTLCAKVAVLEAAQRRLFYSEQLKMTKENLAKAEEAMRGFQEKTGVMQPDAQAQAVITNDAALRAQIAAKEVEINVLKTFSTVNNPDLQKAEEALLGMRQQLSKLEVKGGGGPNPLIPTGRMPSEGLEYVRKLRDVKFNEGLYENLAKLHELAKLDEERSAPITAIQVIDQAVVPEKKAKPKRVLVIFLSLFVGFFLSIFTAFILEYKEKTASRATNSERITLLRKYANFRGKKDE